LALHVNYLLTIQAARRSQIRKLQGLGNLKVHADSMRLLGTSMDTLT